VLHRVLVPASALQRPRLSSKCADYRDLAGQSGRIAFAECQAHVQTPPNIDESSSKSRVRATSA
jgi:hypothetical protein